MVISTDSENRFDKSQHLFMEKTIKEIEIDTNFLNLMSYPAILCPFSGSLQLFSGKICAIIKAAFYSACTVRDCAKCFIDLLNLILKVILLCIYVCMCLCVYENICGIFFIELPSNLCHLHMSKLIKLSTLNMYSSFCINYTSIKVLFLKRIDNSVLAVKVNEEEKMKLRTCAQVTLTF